MINESSTFWELLGTLLSHRLSSAEFGVTIVRHVLPGCRYYEVLSNLWSQYSNDTNDLYSQCRT